MSTVVMTRIAAVFATLF